MNAGVFNFAYSKHLTIKINMLKRIMQVHINTVKGKCSQINPVKVEYLNTSQCRCG